MQDSHFAPDQELKSLTVFFDGQCPLCRREVGFYRRQQGSALLGWVDVGNPNRKIAAPGLSTCNALARFHVMDARGRILSGGMAFARLWLELPAFRWLGRIFQNAPMAWVLERGYDLFLCFRPGLKRIFKR